MSEFHGTAAWPEDFCGQVRLFPLPDTVLFPHVIQPLHIFEPRYCDMLSDALAHDRLIAMALLENGWEQKYKQNPPIASTVCVGRVISHTPTNDGRHNILLVGMKRALVVEELKSDQSFRKARVQIQEDLYPPEDAGGRERLVTRLQELFCQFVPDGLAAQESIKQLVEKQPPLGILTDTITYGMRLPTAIKQQLLAEYNVDIRCRILIRCLEQQLKRDHSDSTELFTDEFPPRFSDN